MMNKASLPVRLMIHGHKIFLFFFYILMRLIMGTFCRLKFRYTYHVPHEIKKLKPPYLILGDHVHPMDPFFNGIPLRPVIHWVAADANFRTPLMKLGMTFLAGAVAKSKNRSDMVALSRLKALVDAGCVIGVFQEGERSWDGVSLPPVKGTDKLIRFLRIPVVYARFDGAYLDHPRWSWSSNHAEIKVSYELVINPEEAGRLPLSEIKRRIHKAGTYNEWDYKDKGHLPLTGNKRAENIELACFICPQCQQINTIRSAGNHFQCVNCGLHGEVGTYGEFIWKDIHEISTPGFPFPTVREWNLWQMAYYKKRVEELANPGDTLFWEDKDTVVLTRGKRGKRMLSLGRGSARFYGDRIEWESPGEKIIMPLDDISSFSVFKQYYTEFFYDKKLHRFTFTNRTVSGYKWLLLFRTFVEFKRERTLND